MEYILTFGKRIPIKPVLGEALIVLHFHYYQWTD